SGWVSAKVVPPNNIAAELEINIAIPICYILRSSSIFDLLMLDIYCQKVGLPRPLASVDELGSNHSYAASAYLARVGLLRTYGAYRHQPPSPFFKLLKRVGEEESFDVQIVPVSIFWGRDPGSSEKSVFKLFFPDDDRAGFFQKAAIVLAHGRNALISFSRPIGMRLEYNGNVDIEQTARKLTRVVRVHFQNKRVSALGPGLISRNRVIETMIRGKHLRQAIDDEAKKKNIPRDRAERLAKDYISEIAAEVTPQIIAGFGILLKKLWGRMYDEIQVEGIERIRQLPANAEVVYVPCHRSHIDYLIVNYVLYQNGVVTPHVAAGVNLNFWPIGSLLRRFGAFYIRRSFNNNRLYSVVFSEYVSFLLQRGSPLQFFLEGGRSRSGKLLTPKTGMIAMVIQTYLRDSSRPIFLVPVYIGYDNVMEVKSYRRELTGSKKQSESVGQLVKTRKALRSNQGAAYIGFGEPMDMKHVLDLERPGWQMESYSFESKPQWLTPLVSTVAVQIMSRINENAILGAVGLVSLILNASRTKAMAEEELVNHIEKFLALSRRLPYSRDVREGKLDVPSKQIVERAEKFGKMSRFSHPGGDVIHLLEPQASYSIYARNNIAHLFALPSLIAFFLQHNDHMSQEFIVRGCRMIYPILTVLRTLGLIVGSAIERFSVAVNLLHQYQDSTGFSSDEFQSKCVLMAQRISLLTGATDNELPSPALFKVIFEQLADEGYIVIHERCLKLTPSFDTVYEITSALLSVDLRHSMSRVRK
ncbi:MAG: glycerol-3-phosphate 1-O-acyltransferase PlsB, partial [Proteobacteria bacterium]|nr:glycerol-3-phosphate 1-O-acyltransferase PlsB [Pseudomonadota bacterium]